MVKTRPEVVPAEVRGVAERFERWRAGKQVGERIPPRLWRAAVKLSRTYSLYRTGRWLRLNDTNLRDHADQRLSAGHPKKPAFVELSLPAEAAAGTSSAEYVVELAVQGNGAQRIHVRGASVSEVAALTRALSAVGGGN